MNIDNKLPMLKNFMSETKLNNAGIKTTLNESAVAASEQNNVDLDLQLDGSGQDSKSKKKKKGKTESKEQKNNVIELPKISAEELKATNLKKLNLL